MKELVLGFLARAIQCADAKNSINRVNIVITGATRGLGFATAWRLLSAGHEVTICSEDHADVEQALESLRAAGSTACGVRCDISSEKEVRGLVRFAREGGRSVDAWINNAGVPGITGRTDQLPAAHQMRVIDVNIRGTCLCSIHALRRFQAQGHGRLCNVVGRGEKSPVPFSNSYGPSKTWVRSFTRAMAAEVQGSAIAVCTFQPGLVHTQMTLDVTVVRGHEARLRALPAIQRYLGNEARVPADSLAKIITGDVRNGRAYRAPVLRPALRRLFVRPPRVSISAEVIEPEADEP